MVKPNLEQAKKQLKAEAHNYLVKRGTVKFRIAEETLDLLYRASKEERKPVGMLVRELVIADMNRRYHTEQSSVSLNEQVHDIASRLTAIEQRLSS